MMQASITAMLLLARMSSAALPEIQIAKHGSSGVAARTARQLFKRTGTVDITVAEDLSDAYGGAYFTTIMVGTPPQSQQVLLDTGSSDTYFLTSSTCVTPLSDPNSCRGGIFFPKNSTSYTVVEPSPAFNTSFGDGSTAVGPLARDAIDIGGLVIENVEFGVAEDVDTTAGFSTGQLGLGYSANEAPTQKYPNLPEVLKDSGAINSRLYSIYLNGFSTSGSVLFGGIDSSKYSGELVTLDLIPGGYTEIENFVTTVTALAVSVGTSGLRETIFSGGSPVSEGNQRNDSALPVLLCIGCGYWEVPTDYYNQLVNSSFTFVDQNGECSCHHRDDDHVLQLVFGAETAINVPARDIIVPLYNTTTGKPLPYTDGSDACGFAITAVSDPSDYYTLGESILRSMYLVFDLDNAQVSIAQAVINSTAPSDVQTVAAGPSGVERAASRVQPAAANTYSIASAASIDASFSTSMASSASASMTSAGTPSTTSSVGTTGTISAASAPSSSKGAGVSNVVRAGGGSHTWMLVVVTLAAAFATGMTR